MTHDEWGRELTIEGLHCPRIRNFRGVDKHDGVSELSASILPLVLSPMFRLGSKSALKTESRALKQLVGIDLEYLWPRSL